VKIKVIKVLAVCAVVYIGAYFFLMAWNVAAFDNSGKAAFRSSFRMAHLHGPIGSGPMLSISASGVSVLNYVFYPMDELYYAIAPTNWSLNTIPAH
jgi:hypothetical protein